MIEQTARAHNSQVARRHAFALLKLGEIRRRLGETREADRLLRRAETAAWALNSPDSKEMAAMAKTIQALSAVNQGQNRDALSICERTVRQFGGIPTLQTTTGGAAPLSGLWLWLLDDAEQYERLYEASGMVMKALRPAEAAAARISLGQAYAWRARSAEHLGRKEEAVELHEMAIAILGSEEQDQTTAWLLDHAVTAVPSLLADLDRDDEAAAASVRVIDRLGTNKTLWGRLMVFVARLRMRLGRADVD